MTRLRLSASRPAPASSTKASATCDDQERVAQPLRRAARRWSSATRTPSVPAVWLRRLYQAMGTADGEAEDERRRRARRARPGRRRRCAAPSGRLSAPSARQQPDAGRADRESRAARRSSVSSVVSIKTSAHDVPAARAERLSHARAPSTRLLARMSSRFVTLTPPMRSRTSTPACEQQQRRTDGRHLASCSGTTSDRKPASAIICGLRVRALHRRCCARRPAPAPARASAAGRSRAIMCDELPECRAFGPRSLGPRRERQVEPARRRQEAEPRRQHADHRRRARRPRGCARPITGGIAAEVLAASRRRSRWRHAGRLVRASPFRR